VEGAIHRQDELVSWLTGWPDELASWLGQSASSTHQLSGPVAQTAGQLHQPGWTGGKSRKSSWNMMEKKALPSLC